MSPVSDDDDVRADELLTAGRVAPGDEALAEVLATMRAMANGPEPRPNAALDTLLRDGIPAASTPVPAPVRTAVPVWRRALRWVTGLGVAGKVVLGAGVAVAGTTGVATIPAVPDAVQVPVHDALVNVGRFITGDRAPGGQDAPPGVAPSGSPSPDEAAPTGRGVAPGQDRDGSTTPGSTTPGDETVTPGGGDDEGTPPAGRPAQGRGTGQSADQGTAGDAPAGPPAGTPESGRSNRGAGEPQAPESPRATHGTGATDSSATGAGQTDSSATDSTAAPTSPAGDSDGSQGDAPGQGDSDIQR